MSKEKEREKLLERIQQNSFFFKSTKPMVVLPIVTTVGCSLPIGLVILDYSINSKIEGPIGLTLLSFVALMWMFYVWIYYFTKIKEKKAFNAHALSEVKKIILNNEDVSDEELERKVNEYLIRITNERTARLKAKEGKSPVEVKNDK